MDKSHFRFCVSVSYLQDRPKINDFLYCKGLGMIKCLIVHKGPNTTMLAKSIYIIPQFKRLHSWTIKESKEFYRTFQKDEFHIKILST